MNWERTVEDYLRTLTPATAGRYRAALDEFAAWSGSVYGRAPDPALLTAEEVREWQAHLSRVRGLKAASVNLRLAALKGLVRAGGRQLDVRGVRQVRAPVDPLSGREVGRLLAALAGERWADRRDLALVSLLIRAGLRVGEAVALDLADLELGERSGWALVRQGKGMKERRVPLSVEARRVLRAYLAVRPAASGAALFVSHTGRRLSARDAQRTVVAAARQAGLERAVTPHTLRHTFATRFLQRGGDLATLQDILGHANLETTSHYLHPNAARVQEMVEGL